MAFVLMQSLTRGKRVRLTDGSLTPVFEYSSQAFKYASSKGINNCDVVKVDIELDFKKNKKRAYALNN